MNSVLTKAESLSERVLVLKANYFSGRLDVPILDVRFVAPDRAQFFRRYA